MMIDSAQRDYYCSMKFRFLKIDLESQTTYTCHAAQPHPVDFAWLSKHSGHLFNNEINLQERAMMLANQRAPSCEQNCWRAEDHDQISPRLYQGGPARTHTNIVADPEIVDLALGSDCNLTCTYCCKEYSTAWRQDLASNGDYDLSDNEIQRYQLSTKDRMLMKISQPNLMRSHRYNLLLDEIRAISGSVRLLVITGGEPFLNNRLMELIAGLELNDTTKIQIYSGLGVDPQRFAKILDKVKSNKQIVITVSAEGIGPYLEFNRYGITWSQFETNLNSIIDRNIAFDFQSQISNLTAFGFREFYDRYSSFPMTMTFVYNPKMQGLHVLDPDSKTNLRETFSSLPLSYRTQLEQTMMPEPGEKQRRDMANFLTGFVSRRPDLDVNLYPRSFLTWLGL